MTTQRQHIIEAFEAINNKQKEAKPQKGKKAHFHFDINIAVKATDRDRYYQLLRENEKGLITLCLLVQRHIELNQKTRYSLQTVSTELMNYLTSAFYDKHH